MMNSYIYVFVLVNILLLVGIISYDGSICVRAYFVGFPNNTK